MRQKNEAKPGPFEQFSPVYKGLWNQADKRPLLKPVDILILADLANWSNVTGNRKREFSWNYEGFETWAKRLGTSKGPLIQRFRRLVALHLVETIVIEHEGRRYHLKRVIAGHLVRWIDREKHPEWIVNVPPIDKAGRLDWKAGRVPVVFDRSKASEDRLQLTYTEHFERRQLTPPKIVHAKVIQSPSSVGPKMLKRCAEYCQLSAAEVVETHPMRIESKRENAEKRKARQLDNDRRNRFKGAKARTLDTCVEAFMILGNQQRKWIAANGQETERLVSRLGPENIAHEAEIFFYHYDARGWQKNGGQHVDDIYKLADDWLKRRERKIADEIKAAWAEDRANQKHRAEAKQHKAEAREAEANTIDVEYFDLDQPTGQALQVAQAIEAEPVTETAEVVLPWSSEAFERVWGQWIEYNRNELGRALSTEVEQLQLHQLQNDCNGDERNAIEATVRAIANGYKGIFPSNKGKGKIGRNMDW
jgi:hypothetical protein